MVGAKGDDVMTESWALSEDPAEPENEYEEIHTKGIDYLEDDKIEHWSKIQVHGSNAEDAERIAERLVDFLNGDI
jgi:hypothetical protein